MFGIVIIGHGKIATGFASALELFGCEMDERCRVVDFSPEESPEKVEEKLAEALEALSGNDGTVIFSDLFFGTPYNVSVSQKLKRPKECIKIVAGANLATILETYMSRDNCIKDVVPNSIELGRSQMVLYEESKTQETEEDEL